MKTPVAFLIFNRPDTTKKVFAAIRQAQPPKLLVVADGARKDRPGEVEKCRATRAIIDRVDWDCEVLTNYSEENLGGMMRISTGLDWVFSLVETAIVLEDDCLPHPTFFSFCEELLLLYQNDERIMTISGDNFQFGRQRGKYSYYFSRYNHCWGWATWRRAWQHYDRKLELWPRIRNDNLIKYIFGDTKGARYWHKIFQAIYENKITHGWDYRWTFACWVQSGLTVLPNVNLISNIGFGKEATHTINAKSIMANMSTEEMYFPLQHPPFVVRDAQADEFTQKTLFDTNVFERIVRKTRKTLGLTFSLG